ncbi:non-ribosomal peptide synthase domain TIGR01720/amino acid adenylation domain-containing protein [Paenibacillus uliginis N3/975]|uniref:Non-ribosomal peptide synthase domain TIGR01720/amino acid adenylation domain-containing protein n=1 Tax=Paenibacillus uliginis N3/975 TaxID=1313296 RepID=A0A1X7GZJ1_9BACL|nr:non-ribosomal peptide synthetase [Paenibacillus uliginis]SMF77018.1 non-ribosomal peptide synthase domain TIGR01720/amino acid adenylation domain-containing protein [Paenibacillus uliginis N3/975]
MNDNKAVYPLTHPQIRIWYIEQQYPHTSIHHLGGLVKICGVPDLSVLEQAIQLCIQKNEGLRLQMIELKGQPYQKVDHPVKGKFDYVDFSTNPHSAEEECKKWVKEKMASPFILLNSPLYYFALCKVAENKYGYLIKLHHIISDGWTMNILTKQISEYYTQLLKDESIDLQVEHSYLAYIEQEQAYLTSKRFSQNKQFWKERFDDLPESSYERISDGIAGKRMTYELSPVLSTKLREYTQRNRFSINAFFNSLMMLYIHKMTQQTDIIIGSPVLNRSGQAERKMIGMFTSTMPFRLKLDTKETLLNVIQKANKELLSCFFNQKYPFDLFVQDIELQKKGRDRLFHVCVNYYSTNLVNTLAGIPLENKEVHNGNQLYSLQMVIKEWSDQNVITLHYDYKIDDYRDKEIDRMHRYMMYLMEQIISNDEITVSEVSLLSPKEEQHLLYEWNNPEYDNVEYGTIQQYFEEQVAKTPDHIALIFEEKQITYRELNEKSNQLARLLRSKNVANDCPVAILGNHSPEIIIAMLAVLKAGSCYLPIDPKYPVDRIQYILNDANVAILLTDDCYEPELKYQGEVIRIDEGNNYVGDRSNLNSINNSNDLAYIIYTSGSTGKPKGVMVHHEGVLNYIFWASEQYIHSQNETFAFYSSIAFDLTVTSIFTPLLNGNSIVIYESNNQEFILERILQDNRTHIIKMTPGHLSLLAKLNVDKSAIRCIIVGGEELKTNVSSQIYDAFRGQVDIYNEYGPTETVVGCMIHRYDRQQDINVSVPIGRPIKNIQIYLLDQNMKLVPPGACGEIYISGMGVARGYLGRETLTEERFLPSPFKEGSKVYKTGDLGRLLENETIEYLGRIDQQVKINGYRIETGEIEHYLLANDKISEAAVIAIHEGGDTAYLTAFIVPKIDIFIIEIRSYLAELLPYYMLPSVYKFIKNIPLNKNGKVDKFVLNEKIKMDTIIDEDGRNDTELTICNIYKEVLNISKVSIHDHFYRMGGDSIKAIQVTSKLRELNYQVKVQDIMTYPTISELAMKLKEGGEFMVPQETCEGEVGPLPIVSWFFEQKFQNVHHWNQSVFLKIKKMLDVQMLECILVKLVQHHDSLRLNYDSQSESLYYNQKHWIPTEMVYHYDLSRYNVAEQQTLIKSIGKKLKASMNIESSILFKAGLIDCGSDRGLYLLLTAHHLVIDAISWRILLEDFARLYVQLAENQALILPLKTHSIQRWSECMNSFKENEGMVDLAYWNKETEIDFSLTTTTLNQDEYPAVKETISQSLTIPETETLLTTANIAYNTKPQELLVTALVQTLAQFTNIDEILIELEGHGRENLDSNVDITRTVGWFTSIYPVHFKWKEQALDKQIVSTKEKLRNIPRNGIGYGALKYLTTTISQPQNKRVRFNYLGQFEQNTYENVFEISDASLTGEDIAVENEMTAMIDIVALVLEKELRIAVTYSNHQFDLNEMTGFATLFANNLKLLVKYCNGKEIQGYTPSDFDAVDLSQEELEMLFE